MRTDDIPRFTVTQGIINRTMEINRLASLCRSIGNRSVDMKLRRSCLAALSHLKDERMSDLLEAMGDKPMTSTEIMERMGLSNKQHFLKHRLRPAVELGFVSMTDPDHPRSSRQRYVKRIL